MSEGHVVLLGDSIFGNAAYTRGEPDVASHLRAVLPRSWNVTLGAPRARAARIALTPFNDVILRFAFERGMAAVDLRLVCSEPADYANPIEPSGRGGLKIARAIPRAVGARDGAHAAAVFALSEPS